MKILPRHNGVGWRPLDGVNGCVFHYFYFFRRAERIRPGVGVWHTNGGRESSLISAKPHGLPTTDNQFLNRLFLVETNGESTVLRDVRVGFPAETRHGLTGSGQEMDIKNCADGHALSQTFTMFRFVFCPLT